MEDWAGSAGCPREVHIQGTDSLPKDGTSGPVALDDFESGSGRSSTSGLGTERPDWMYRASATSSLSSTAARSATF